LPESTWPITTMLIFFEVLPEGSKITLGALNLSSLYFFSSSLEPL
jgi:hypothetical protein